ncbi:MAG: hypothetical protein Q7S74_05970 [Nanoarchaeota archaeon]|nr:hypothetical protein [Nanoarchaeota archaeon]
MYIKEVKARKIKDSRNQYTIEVSVNGQVASAPSGKSTGKYETPCYHKSLGWNINFLNKAPLDIPIGSFADLHILESYIKKTAKLKDVKQFGANALFALESATLKALAKEQKKQLWQIINPKANKMPIPVGNAIGGGLHSHNKNHPTFQEFLLIPKGKNFKENYSILKAVYKSLKSKIKATAINDEGAWQTSLNEEQVLEVLSKYKNKINMGVDVASSSFFCDKEYKYKNRKLNKEAQIWYMNDLIKKFNIFYLEDPIQEEDFQGFSQVHRSSNHLVVGDDLTATHISRLKIAIKNKSINAMIVKPNQNGSLLEVKQIIDLCKKNNIKTILSHRSGETLDNSLADYAFAFQTDFIKCGIATKWREVKLKRLLEIENSIRNV